MDSPTISFLLLDAVATHLPATTFRAMSAVSPPARRAVMSQPAARGVIAYTSAEDSSFSEVDDEVYPFMRVVGPGGQQQTDKEFILRTLWWAKREVAILLVRGGGQFIDLKGQSKGKSIAEGSDVCAMITKTNALITNLQKSTTSHAGYTIKLQPFLRKRLRLRANPPVECK